MSTLYWENLDRSYDDFEKEGINLDDLLVKSKFLFMNGKYTFSSKSKFNLGAKAGVTHEYAIKHKCPRATIDVKVKDQGESTLEAEANCLEKNDLRLTSYGKVVHNFGENSKSCNANVMLRFHHKNNSLLSLGLENWSACKGAPEVLSAYTSYAHNAEGYNLVFNSYFNFDFKNKFLPLARFLLHAKKGDFNGYFQANVNRSQVDTEDKENPKATSQAVDLVFKFLNQVCPKTRVGGAIRYNLEDKKSDAVIVVAHTLDRVKLNGKLATDRTLTFGVTSVFDDITVNFAAKTGLNCALEKCDDHEVKKHWFTHKFGLSVEFNRI